MIIIGLGNPGEKYERTRHNAAWIVFDEFGFDWTGNKYAESLEAKNGELVFVKPQTFMNDSGRSVTWYQKEYGIPAEDFVVVYDDVALPIGKIRVSFDRSSGGHNGVASIEQALGGRTFVRVRIGISPKTEDGEVQDPESRKSFVLKDFSNDDIETLKKLAPKIKTILDTIARDGHEKAMNTFN